MTTKKKHICPPTRGAALLSNRKLKRSKVSLLSCEKQTNVRKIYSSYLNDILGGTNYCNYTLYSA